MVSPFVDQLMRFIRRFRNTDGGELEIETAVREALTNAIVDRNKEDARKHVYVVCRCTTDGAVSVRVENEGQGLDTDNVADLTTPENRSVPYGSGIELTTTSMDEIVFEQSGAIIYMRKGPR